MFDYLRAFFGGELGHIQARVVKTELAACKTLAIDLQTLARRVGKHRWYQACAGLLLDSSAAGTAQVTRFAA